MPFKRGQGDLTKGWLDSALHDCPLRAYLCDKEWVKEIGLASFAAGLLWTIIGFIEMGKVIPECAPDVDLYIVWAAVPCALIPAAYGTVVYIISLIIRIIRKPRI